ncbi:hypothetical protein CWI39_0116p0010, partial [Hamiltosporidium magnivora]
MQKNMKFLIPIPSSPVTKRIENSLENRNFGFLKSIKFSDINNLIAYADINVVKLNKRILNMNKINRLGLFLKGKCAYKSFLGLTKAVLTLFKSQINAIAYMKINNVFENKTFIVELTSKDKEGLFKETLLDFRFDNDSRKYTAVDYITFFLFSCQVSNYDFVFPSEDRPVGSLNVELNHLRNIPGVSSDLNIIDVTSNHSLDENIRIQDQILITHMNTGICMEEDLRREVPSFNNRSYEISTLEFNEMTHTTNQILEIDNTNNSITLQTFSDTASALKSVEESFTISNPIATNSSLPENSLKTSADAISLSSNDIKSENVLNPLNSEPILISGLESSDPLLSVDITQKVDFKINQTSLEIATEKKHLDEPLDDMYSKITSHREILDIRAITPVESISHEDLPESNSQNPESFEFGNVQKKHMISPKRIFCGISSLNKQRNSEETEISSRTLKKFNRLASSDTIRSIHGMPNQNIAENSSVECKTNSTSFQNLRQSLNLSDDPKSSLIEKNNILSNTSENIAMEKQIFTNKEAKSGLDTTTVEIFCAESFQDRTQGDNTGPSLTLFQEELASDHKISISDAEFQSSNSGFNADSVSQVFVEQNLCSGPHFDPASLDASPVYQEEHYSSIQTTELNTKPLSIETPQSKLNYPVGENVSIRCSPLSNYPDSQSFGARNKYPQYEKLHNINNPANTPSEIDEVHTKENQSYMNKSNDSGFEHILTHSTAAKSLNSQNTEVDLETDLKDDTGLKRTDLNTEGKSLSNISSVYSQIVMGKETQTGCLRNIHGNLSSEEYTIEKQGKFDPVSFQLESENESLIDAILNSSSESEKHTLKKFYKEISFQKINEGIVLETSNQSNYGKDAPQKSTEYSEIQDSKEIIEATKQVSPNPIENRSDENFPTTPFSTQNQDVKSKKMSCHEEIETELFDESIHLIEGASALPEEDCTGQANIKVLLDYQPETTSCELFRLNESYMDDAYLNYSDEDSYTEQFNSYS